MPPQVDLAAQRRIADLVGRCRLEKPAIRRPDLLNFRFTDFPGTGGAGDLVEGLERMADRHASLVPVMEAGGNIEWNGQGLF